MKINVVNQTPSVEARFCQGGEMYTLVQSGNAKPVTYFSPVEIPVSDLPFYSPSMADKVMFVEFCSTLGHTSHQTVPQGHNDVFCRQNGSYNIMSIIPHIKHAVIDGVNHAIVELGYLGTLTIPETDGCRLVADRICDVLARLPHTFAFMHYETKGDGLY